jgi:hypothetical protein
MSPVKGLPKRFESTLSCRNPFLGGQTSLRWMTGKKFRLDIRLHDETGNMKKRKEAGLQNP